jgi:hypothetical protein
MHRVPWICPTCAGPLEPRELACAVCATTVRGSWVPTPISRLTAEQMTFLLLFVRSRGNLSDVERTLGVSYPTVRAKLDDLIAALDEPRATVASAPAAADRQAVLAQVARGEIGIDEALGRLRSQPPQTSQEVS